MGNMVLLQRAMATGLVCIAAAVGLSGCNDPSYKVTGDNKSVLSEYTAKREAAIAYLLKTSVYVGEIRAMKELPAGAALPAQSQKMLALRGEADALGGIISPLSHCRGAGYKAQEYWAVVEGSIRTETPDSALAGYVEEAQQCQEQIDNPPKSETYIETAIGGKPPVSECLEVVSLGSDEKVQAWSCPSELLSKR